MAKKTRFQLRSDETATQNLWRAIGMATLYLLKRRNFYGLTYETRQELIDETMLAAYYQFMEHKIRRRKYNRNFCFFDNVLSTVWSVSVTVADRVIKQLDMVVHSEDVNSQYHQDTLPTQAGFPGYLADHEHRFYKHVPLDKMGMGAYAHAVKQEYADQRDEAIELGLTPPTWEAWLASTGYARDAELMLWLEPEHNLKVRTINLVRRSPELAGKYPRTCNARPGKKRGKK